MFIYLTAETTKIKQLLQAYHNGTEDIDFGEMAEEMQVSGVILGMWEVMVPLAGLDKAAKGLCHIGCAERLEVYVVLHLCSL